MIHFDNASRWFPGPRGNRIEVLAPTTLSLPTHRRIGVLGEAQSGKTTLLRMIAGQLEPSTGEIVRSARVSPPVGFAGSVHPDLTGIENAAFVARVYEEDIDEVVAFVTAFSGLGELLDQPVRTWARGLRARFAWSLSLALHFDCYLLDDRLGTGDRAFKEKCADRLLNVFAGSGLILTSRSPKTILGVCDLALVLIDTVVVPFTDVEAAVEYYEYHQE